VRKLTTALIIVLTVIILAGSFTLTAGYWELQNCISGCPEVSPDHQGPYAEMKRLARQQCIEKCYMMHGGGE